MNDLLGPIWQILLERAMDRAKVPPPPWKDGFDNPPALALPQQSVEPWRLNLSGREARLSLPANKGANFEGYLNYHFNPFAPQDFRINGGGLRYRYAF